MKKLGEKVTCPDTCEGGAAGECSQCQVCVVSLQSVCFRFLGQKLPHSFWAWLKIAKHDVLALIPVAFYSGVTCK